MQIRLNDGTVLEALTVNGNTTFFQGANRDSLEIQFEKSGYPFDEMDALTAGPAKMQKLTIEGENGASVYEGYVLRTGIGIKAVVTEQSVTPDKPAQTQERLCVTLAQKTYMEQQLDMLRDTVDMLVLSAL